jgi:S-DNA-T family DNA segregation ATPase FtsK/SpoIIIE
MKKELAGIILFFLIVLTSVSLFSYHVDDPHVGHNFFSLPDNIHNSVGLFGAHLSGLFVFLFGMGAFWIPVVLGFISVWLLKERSKKVIWLTLLGGLLLMISSGGMAFLFKDNYQLWGTSVSSGGIIGISITSFLLKYANITGCIIILLFLMVVGFILSTGISVITLATFINEKTRELFKIMQDDFKEFSQFTQSKLDDWKKRREEARKQIDITPMVSEVEDTVSEKKKDLIKIPEIIEHPEPEPRKKKKKKADDGSDPVIVELEDELPEFKGDVEFNDIRETIEFKLPLISFLDEKKKVKRNINTDLLKEKARS